MVFIFIPSNNLTLVCIWTQVSTWIRGKKCSMFGEDLFFWSLLNLVTWKKSWSRFIPPMLKIGQNWGKIANYCISPMLNKDLHSCFHDIDKTNISWENLRVDYYLLLKYCTRQCTLFPSTWDKPLAKFNAKMQDFKRVLDLNCKWKEDGTI